METMKIYIIAYGDIIRMKLIKISSSTSAVPQSPVKSSYIKLRKKLMDREMGDMRDVITGRSTMRRARPLFIMLNTIR